MDIRWDDLRLERIMLGEYKKALDYYLKHKIQGSAQIRQLQDKFEGKFSRYLGVKYAIALNSGSDAFAIALRILGVKRGDSVIISNITYATIPLAIIQLGAKPSIVDINKNDLNLNADLIESKINTHTKVIVASSLFGRPCDINKIIKIAKKHKLKIIEDVCQSFGSQYKGKNIGTFGDMSFFSFSYNKSLSSCAGSGGMLCFNKNKYLKIARMFTKGNFLNQETQRSLRVPAMQFFDLLSLEVKFKYLRSIFDSRRMLKKLYEEELQDVSQIKIFKDQKDINSIPSLNFVIFANSRDQLSDYLESKRVDLLNWQYPCSVLSGMKIFKKNISGGFPVSKAYTKKALYLPLFSFMKEEEVKRITSLIKKFYKNT